MGVFVYLLCAITSSGCAILLLRAYFKGRANLLLWSGICFTGLALNNIILFVDSMLGPSYDLSLPRSIIGLGGLCVMIYGLIWDTV